MNSPISSAKYICVHNVQLLLMYKPYKYLGGGRHDVTDGIDIHSCARSILGTSFHLQEVKVGDATGA